MGIVPIWGFQMLIAISVAIFFRLNKALVILAANISIPPFIPVIIYLSHLTGAIWMGTNAVKLSFDKEITIEFLQNSFGQYVAGAITLAIMAGLTFGILTALLLKLKHKRSIPV